MVIILSLILINAPEGCQHGTHTNTQLSPTKKVRTMRASSYLIYYALDRETRGLDGYCTGSSEHKEGSSRLHYPLVA